MVPKEFGKLREELKLKRRKKVKECGKHGRNIKIVKRKEPNRIEEEREIQKGR